MAQHDYAIANQTGLEFRADLNNVLSSIVTQNSGTTEPADKFAGMFWLDTSSSPPILKQRNQANNAWTNALTSTGMAVSGATSVANQRTALGLGTAATLDVGTSASNVVQLDGTAKLPAVDGSQLTNLPSTGLAAASTAQAQAYTSDSVAITPLKLKEAMQGSNYSLGASGYQKLPSGFIIQWGKSAVIGSNTSVSVTFPLTFPTACVSVVATPESPAAGNGSAIGCMSFTASGAVINNGNTETNNGVYYIAFGY